LILDEPTNDLDLITLNTLEDYLLKFGGCLIVVSHDRYFIDRLVDHLFVFDGLGSIKNVPGNFTDYRTSLVGAKKAPAAGTGKPAPKKSKPTKKKLSFNEKREFERLEDEIAVLEQEIEVLNKKLTQANDDYAQLTTWGKQLAEIKAEIAKKEDRWLELAELA
jgi:ABC transport system ATP-binding/permease protein